MAIGENLQKSRKQLGLNQANMALSIDVADKSYWNYEKNITPIPSDVLVRLYETHNISPTFLLTGQGPMFLPAKNEKLEKYEQAFKERKTFGKRLNYYQAEENLMDDEIAKIINSTESRVEKLGLDKNEPTLAELRALKSYSGISIDLWVDGELTGDCACVTQMLSPEEQKMLEFLKKAKENKLI